MKKNNKKQVEDALRELLSETKTMTKMDLVKAKMEKLRKGLK